MIEFLLSLAVIALAGMAMALGTLLGKGPFRRGCPRTAHGAPCDRRRCITRTTDPENPR